MQPSEFQLFFDFGIIVIYFEGETVVWIILVLIYNLY